MSPNSDNCLSLSGSSGNSGFGVVGYRYVSQTEGGRVTSRIEQPRERLQDALRLNAPLAIAYYLKDDLRQIWCNQHRCAFGVF